MKQQQRRDGELLRRVILSESLTTVFEPIVRLSDRSVIGYEAYLVADHAAVP